MEVEEQTEENPRESTAVENEAGQNMAASNIEEPRCSWHFNSQEVSASTPLTSNGPENMAPPQQALIQ